MVDTLPRSNLPPESEPWRREIERLLAQALGTAGRARTHAVAASAAQASLMQTVTEQAQVIALQAEQITQQAEIIQPSVPPRQPTPPEVSTMLGAISIRWDGLLEVEQPVSDVPGEPSGEPANPPTPPDYGFKEVTVEISAVDPDEIEIVVDPDDPDPEYESPWRRMGQSLLSAGEIVLSDVPVGETRWCRLIAVNYAGQESSPSIVVPVTVEGVVVGQIEDGAVLADNIAEHAIETRHLVANAITAEQIAPGAVGAAEIADFALTVKKFNSDRHMLY